MAQEIKEKQLFTYASKEGLDPVDIRLLGELQRDPRQTKAELGRRIGMSAPAVGERLRRLEEAGVILGYRLEVDPAALGLPIAAYIRVRPNPGQLPKVASWPQLQVVECLHLANCFILKFIPAMSQLDRILDSFSSTA
jgi:Lrp/AsnC family leucine-responsive transcriptional regulator